MQLASPNHNIIIISSLFVFCIRVNFLIYYINYHYWIPLVIEVRMKLLFFFFILNDYLVKPIKWSSFLTYWAREVCQIGLKSCHQRYKRVVRVAPSMFVKTRPKNYSAKGSSPIADSWKFYAFFGTTPPTPPTPPLSTPTQKKKKKFSPPQKKKNFRG